MVKGPGFSEPIFRFWFTEVGHPILQVPCKQCPPGVTKRRYLL